jgi:hypothetical protein
LGRNYRGRRHSATHFSRNYRASATRRLISVEITVQTPLGDSFQSKLPCTRHSATHFSRNCRAGATRRLI